MKLFGTTVTQHRLITHTKHNAQNRIESFIIDFKTPIQACNQEFFGAGKVSWNGDTLINVSRATHKRKAPQV